MRLVTSSTDASEMATKLLLDVGCASLVLLLVKAAS